MFIHFGQPLVPHDLWGAWTLEPSLLIPLGLTVILYWIGVRNLWKRAGTGHGVSRKDSLRFIGAILAITVALVSPLDALSEALFSAHMVQHLVLILIAAPLLVTSNFPLALVWALPRPWAHALGNRLNRAHGLIRLWKAVSSPVSAWLWFTIVFWTWHAPTLFESALRSEAIHAVEHLLFMATAMLFWWVLFRPTGQKALHYGIAIPYLFTTAMQSGILGALMTFTSQPWYPYYAPSVAAWGMTPLEDQQLAGLIMWLPGGVIFTLLTIGYFAVWLRALEQRSIQLQSSDAPRTHHEVK